MGWLDDILGLGPATGDGEGTGGQPHGPTPVPWPGEPAEDAVLGPDTLLGGDWSFANAGEPTHGPVVSPSAAAGQSLNTAPAIGWNPEANAAAQASLVAAPARDRRTAVFDRREDAGMAPQLNDPYWDVIRGSGAHFSVAENPEADASMPFREIPSFSLVPLYDREISKITENTGVDPDLIRAIMYMETTHGYYDYMSQNVLLNKSILPMNIRLPEWGKYFGDREKLEDPYTNIAAAADIIRGIINNSPEEYGIAQIATLYNNLSASKVSDYGARVAEIYRTRAWEYQEPYSWDYPPWTYRR